MYEKYIWTVGESFKDTRDHCNYVHNLGSCESKDWKNSGLNQIRAHDLCDTDHALLYQFSY